MGEVRLGIRCFRDVCILISRQALSALEAANELQTEASGTVNLLIEKAATAAAQMAVTMCEVELVTALSSEMTLSELHTKVQTTLREFRQRGLGQNLKEADWVHSGLLKKARSALTLQKA